MLEGMNFTVVLFLFYESGKGPTLMGTKNLYENGPNPFFLFGTKHLVRPTLMGTKIIHQHGQHRQVWVRPDFSLN